MPRSGRTMRNLTVRFALLIEMPTSFRRTKKRRKLCLSDQRGYGGYVLCPLYLRKACCANMRLARWSLSFFIVVAGI